MKTRNWTNKVLWFVLGLVIASLLTTVATSRGGPVQDVQQEIGSLKTRVYNLEQYNKSREAAEAEEHKRNRYNKEPKN